MFNYATVANRRRLWHTKKMPEATFIPPSIPLTPMLTQYVEVKKQHPDSILFYRMGDFYEMFFQDAIDAAPLLEVQLTSRDKTAENPIPMCGIPHHAALNYAQRLLEAGRKVAFCDQVGEVPTKGLVKREVIRVLTPALIGDPDLVPEDSRNILAVLFESKDGFELAAIELLGSRVQHGYFPSEPLLLDVLKGLQPKELLVPRGLSEKSVTTQLRTLFPKMPVTIRETYFVASEKTPTLTALRKYLDETQKIDTKILEQKPESFSKANRLSMDSTAVRSLEILEGMFTPDGPCLFRTLDKTLTPMGRRLLKDWLIHPLSELAPIMARQSAVHAFLDSSDLHVSLRKALANIRDLERLTTKTALRLAMPRDLVAIREVLKTLPSIQHELAQSPSEKLQDVAKNLSLLPDLVSLLEAALEDIAPIGYRDGEIIRETYHPDVKELRHLCKDAKGTIAALEAREKERTGISSLKVKYSRVFGYTIEVTSSQLSKVPKEYIRKQTIANGERFITEELKSFEDRALTADQKVKSLEEALFLKIRDAVALETPSLLKNAHSLAELDVLQSFAEKARQANYIAPEVHDGYELLITEGRHPVVESILAPGKFVPNSVRFDQESCRTLIITGPNMAGKSTVMRQAAIIALMAHAGSYVPASRAKIPLIDAIFTRIGSSDDLAGGRSTFMVEMSEIAGILSRATKKSLLIVDEIGRGTSTYDGLSLAWSIVEHLHNEIGAKTLFATHFHEITSLEKSLSGLKNANVLVDKWNNEIVFLHKMAMGCCHQSYGIEVAKLAELPSKVLLRARDILGVLETQSQRANRTRSAALETRDKQMAFFGEIKSTETRASTEI